MLAALKPEAHAGIEALAKIKDIATKVATHTEDDTPAELVGQGHGAAFLRLRARGVRKVRRGKSGPAARIALAVVERIRKHKIRDWRDNQDALNRMRGEIDDIFFEVAGEKGMKIPLDVQDRLIDQCIEVAIANEDVK